MGDELRDYIRHALTCGHNIKEVRKDCIDAGWGFEVLDEVIRRELVRYKGHPELHHKEPEFCSSEKFIVPKPAIEHDSVKAALTEDLKLQKKNYLKRKKQMLVIAGFFILIISMIFVVIGAAIMVA